MTVRVSTLDNGLRVATDTMDSVESVSLGAWVGVGTRHESPELNGVAHFLEHMVFKGTRRRSARDIAEQIEAVGGQINAYTGRENTAFYAKVLAEDAPLALDILADILQHSVFDQTELARERAVILQEIGQAADTPDDIVFDHFQETAFPSQALGRPVLGRCETVSALDRRSLVDYLSRHYGAGDMVVAAAGQIEHAAFRDTVARAFDALPSGGELAPEPAAYRGGDHREARDLEQVHLILGFDGLGYHDPDYYGSLVLSTLLAAACPRACSRRSARNGGSPTPSIPSSRPTAMAGCSASTPGPAKAIPRSSCRWWSTSSPSCPGTSARTSWRGPGPSSRPAC